MTLTTPESTLLSNIKLYLAKADTELSEEGIKSLVKLTQFNTIVQRIARVAPDSLEKVIFVALDVLQAYKERQKDEKKKRALETKEADGKDLPMIKRRKLVTPDVERGRRSTNTPAVQITGSANKASDLIKSKNSLVQNKAKTDASNNNHTLSATSHLSPEASTASTSTAPTSTAPTSTAPTSTAPTSTAPMSTAPTSSSVSSSPSEDSSIHSVISTRPSAIASISFHDTEKQPRIRASKPTRSDDFRDAEKQPQINVSHPIRSDDTRASGKPEQRTTTTVLNDPMDQAERRIHQPPLQDLSSSNTHLHPLAMENPEIAIFAEDKDIVQQLRSHFEEELYPDFSRSIKAAKSDEHISEVLGLCPMLNFDKVKHDLLTFMVQQKQDSNTWSQVVDLAEDAEPVAIFQAIKVSGANEADAKLRRIYWQIHLVKSIDRKIQEGYTPRAYDSVDSIPKAELPSFYLDDMADQMSRGLSPDARKKLERQLRSERQAGINWTKIVDNLGGMGIVFVFVFAGKSIRAVLEKALINLDLALRNQPYQACYSFQ